MNNNKPRTVRVVFDASAKCGNISLNNKLLPVKDNSNILVGILTKFRYIKYAVMGDIEKMILQMKVKKEDLDAL